MSALLARLRSAARRRLPRGLRRVLGAARALVVPPRNAPPAPGGSRKKPARHTPLTGGARLLADYAELAKPRRQRAFMSTLLRTRSRPAREILAHLASG